jgi:acetyl esterase
MKVLAGHGYTMVAVEYPRGYGTTYPKPVEQVNVRRSRVSHSQRGGSQSSPATIILAGDSAGAHIASQVALITADPAYASAAGTSLQLKANQLSAMLLVPVRMIRPRSASRATTVVSQNGAVGLLGDEKLPRG